MVDLFEAIKRDTCDQLEELIRKEDLEKKDSEGFTPLQVSALAASTKCMKILLAAGANPNAATANGYTALHLTALTDPSEADVQIDALVTCGANLEARLRGDETYGRVGDWTPIMLAAADGSAAAVEALAKSGAAVNAVDSIGRTALMLAASNTSETENKVRALIAAGAQKEMQSNERKTAFEYAREHQRLLIEGQQDPTIQQWMEEKRRRANSELEAAGMKADGLVLPDIAHGIRDILDKWPRVLELLEIQQSKPEQS